MTHGQGETTWKQPWLHFIAREGKWVVGTLKTRLLYCSGLNLESSSKTHALNICSQHAALLEDGTFHVDLVGGS